MAWLLGFALLLWGTVSSRLRAAEPSPAAGVLPVTEIRRIRELSPSRAAERRPVTVEGVMTFVDDSRFMCFVQDATGGLYLETVRDENLRTGQRVRAVGRTEPGRFTPFVRADEVTVLGTADLPAPRRVELHEFRAGFLEGERVAVRGRIVALAAVDGRLRVKLSSSGEQCVAWIGQPEGVSTNDWPGAEVRIAGVCAGVFNERSEIVDFHLHAADGTAVEVLVAAPRLAGESAPEGPIKALEGAASDGGALRVRCRGRVTLCWPGRYLFIADGSQSLELRTDEPLSFTPGDEVEVTGVRTVAHRRMVLSECTVTRVGRGELVTPLPTDLARIHARHSHGDLVELEGELVDVLDSVADDDMPGGRSGTERAPAIVLRDGDRLLRVEFAPGVRAGNLALPPRRSRIAVPGVLAARPESPGEPMAYRLLAGAPAAIRVIREAPWWTLPRALAAGGGLGLVVVSGLGWGVGLSERKRRRAEESIQRHREKAMRHRDALLGLARLVQTRDETEALPAITELVSTTLGEPRVSVWRLEEDGASLVGLDLFVEGRHRSGDRLDLRSLSAYSTALRDNRIIAADVAATDPRTREFAPDYLGPNDIRSMLDVPLRHHGRPAGVLCIEHVGSVRVWDDEDQAFAAAVADQLTILREASERRRAEAALREAHAELEIRVVLRTTELAEARDRAEAADRLKSAFLATMSHELRTPLNSIIGFTGILVQGLAGPLNPEQNRQLGMVQNSARHLLSLINDVLDISKIEAGQVELSIEPFDARAAAARVAELISPLAARKGLTLAVELDPAVGVVRSDRRRVEQVLINLLNNAVKFTEQGAVRLEAGLRDGLLEWRVVDTGIGIREEEIARLFKPFRQLDTGLARHHEGTGLGLAICAGIARLLKGRIEVRSEFGRGSTFVFLQPVEGGPSHEDHSDHRG